MSIFWQVLKEEDTIKVPDENEEDTLDTTIEEEPEEDNTPEEEPENEEPDEEDNTPEEEDEQPEEEEDDFTLDGTDDDTGDDEDESEDDSSTDDNYNDTEDDTSADGRLKELQAEVDAELSETEKKNRDKSLKGQYIDLYNTTSNILMGLNAVLRTPDNISVINYIDDTLGELNIRISDYLLDVYSSKSYTQNLSMYYSMLDIFSNMQKLLTSTYNNNVNQEM